jgi:hypothetical protein
MTTMIPLTLHLLVVIGLYDLAAGLAGLTGQIDWRQMIDEFDRSPALTFVMGFLAFIVGAVLIIAHSHWTDLPAAIVSAVGWIAAVEGLFIMTLPGPLFAFSRGLVSNQRLISLFAALIGAVLILIGLTGRADATALS